MKIVDIRATTVAVPLEAPLRGYCYDRDPGRPGWFAVIPESRFAQPAQSKKTK
jgi:hypothetical protein